MGTSRPAQRCARAHYCGAALAEAKKGNHEKDATITKLRAQLASTAAPTTPKSPAEATPKSPAEGKPKPTPAAKGAAFVRRATLPCVACRCAPQWRGAQRAAAYRARVPEPFRARGQPALGACSGVGDAEP